ALLIGLGAGWFFGGRAGAKLAEERGEAAKLLRLQLTEVEKERDEANRLREEAQRELTGINAARAEREAALQEQIKGLVEAKEQLSAQFSDVGAKLLQEAQKNFLERADQRFNQAGERHEEKLKALLQPVETTLKRYEEGLTKVEKERVGSYEALKEAVAQLAQGNETVRRETQRLANVMRSSPKARGRWGEEQLRTILEAAGLAENVDFTLQSTVSDGDRQLRPDCVINLPGERCIVIDVKCPLVAFEQAFDEEDESVRADLLLQHAAAMKSYANDLGRKGYWRQFDLSPDFVIMFIPGEHFLSAAAERAPDLIETAFKNGVIIASTINMLALAKIMAGMWRQETLAKQAKEVAEVGKELYRRLSIMGGHVAKLGRNLNLATGAYNDFVGSLESQVLTQAKRFEAMKVETGGKSIENVPLVEMTPRVLTKLSGEETAEAAE
ncbi:MAG TPA: DNA recombination protein RmuC, partial [Allosphingosinicella sp.]|nr:DNA recombination protein RmuC [Allosphingosinicella sp.]